MIDDLAIGEDLWNQSCHRLDNLQGDKWCG